MRQILLLGALLLPSPVMADPIFLSDGGTHVADSSGSTYQVANGTLNITPSSSALSVTAFAQSITGAGAGAAVNMTGGQVNAGIEINQASLNASGGAVRGFDSSLYGGDGVMVSDGTANIAGGTFIGGNTSNPDGQAGSAVVGSAGTSDGKPVRSTLNISGGTFTGGTGAGGFYGGTTGYSLISIGNTTVTGGHFQSPIAINTAYGGRTDFIGTHLSYHDQVLSGVLSNGDPINVRIYPDATSAVVNATGTDVTFGSSSPPPPNPPVTPAPEAGSALIFSLLAGAYGLALRRRRVQR
jgi:hypothetical protein